MKKAPAKSTVSQNSLHTGFTQPQIVSQMVHRYSIKIKLRKESPRKDGTVPVQLQAIINRKRCVVQLNINCMIDEFDENTERIKYDKKKDPKGLLSSEANYTIDQARVRAQQVFNKYRYLDKPLNTQLFIKDFESAQSHKSFCSFIRNIVLPDAEKVLTTGTIRSWNSALVQLEAFKPDVTLSELNALFIHDLDNSMRKNGIGMNTRMKYHKIVKHFCKKAVMHHHLENNPYTENQFKIKNVDVSRTSLTIEEIGKLVKIYDEKVLLTTDHNELRNFLFCCFTGLRHSDMKQIKDVNIVNDMLVFVPVKLHYLGQVVQVPLNKMAKKFLTENEFTSQQIFDAHSNEHSNRCLKTIAKVAAIKKNLTTHVARHSFATNYLELGGDVVSLQQILGHRKIETTMKYVHLSQKKAIAGVANFDKQFQ